MKAGEHKLVSFILVSSIRADCDLRIEMEKKLSKFVGWFWANVQFDEALGKANRRIHITTPDDGAIYTYFEKDIAKLHVIPYQEDLAYTPPSRPNEGKAS